MSNYDFTRQHSFVVDFFFSVCPTEISDKQHSFLVYVRWRWFHVPTLAACPTAVASTTNTFFPCPAMISDANAFFSAWPTRMIQRANTRIFFFFWKSNRWMNLHTNVVFLHNMDFNPETSDSTYQHSQSFCKSGNSFTYQLIPTVFSFFWNMDLNPEPSSTTATVAAPLNGYNNHCSVSHAGFEFTDIRYVLRKISCQLDESYAKWQKSMEQVSLCKDFWKWMHK